MAVRHSLFTFFKYNSEFNYFPAHVHRILFCQYCKGGCDGLKIQKAVERGKLARPVCEDGEVDEEKTTERRIAEPGNG